MHNRLFGSLENSIKMIPLFLLINNANEISDMQNMLINKTKEKYQKLKQECNKIMFQWLESLLEAVKQGIMSSEEFDKITLKELNIVGLKEIANSLNRIMISLTK